MQAIQHTYNPASYSREAKKTVAHKFMDWCSAQEKDRLMWLAAIITVHACVLTPLTLVFIMSAGTSMLLFALAIAAMTMSLVVNLAAMPVKITIPVFFLSVVIDLAVITACIATVLT